MVYRLGQMTRVTVSDGSMKNRLIKYFGAVCFFVSGSLASANYLSELSFEDQFAQADVVVIAHRVHSRILDRDENEIEKSLGIKLQQMKLSKVLKGTLHSQYIYFVTDNGVSEFSPKCCDRNGSYILLLKMGKRGVFEAVNGQFSAIYVNR